MKNLFIFGTIGILTFVLIDILIRLFYCSGINLKFDTNEFNNISTPVIAFLGFIGLIVTILISLNQIKGSRSENYYQHYKDLIGNILIDEKENPSFTKVELIGFLDYIEKRYLALKQTKDYDNDQRNFIQNKIEIDTNTRDYKELIGNARVFKVFACLFFKELSLLIDEINKHNQLTPFHKDLLLDKLFNNVITKYLVDCEVLDDLFSDIKSYFYVGFKIQKTNNPYNSLLMVDDLFLELYNKVNSDNSLTKYYDKYKTKPLV